MRPLRKQLIAALGAVALCVAMAAAGPGVAAAQTEVPGPVAPALTACAGTFQVLDRAKVGSFLLPARAYTLSTTSDLNCVEAARLFTLFQQTWGNKFPLGWKVVGGPSGFSNASGQRFSIKPAAGWNTTPGSCPFVTVVNGGSINSVYFGGGRYRLTGITPSSLSCSAAARNFFSLLNHTADPDGNWRANSVGAGVAQLSRGSASFTLRRVFANIEGGGTSLARGEFRCGPFFTVKNNDPIGKKFTVLKGRYSVTTFGSTDCAKAVSILPTLLGRGDGVLPSPWRLRPDVGSFVRSASGASGFRLSPYQGP
ncbi:MAG: hypothetical protein WCK97_07335 [Actinomycetes bacterium]